MPHDILNLLDQAINQAKKAGADAADAVAFSSQDVSVTQRLGKSEHIERAESMSLGLRVMIKGKKGYRQSVISSTELSEPSIVAMAERSFDMAKVAPVDIYSGLAEEHLLATDIADLDLVDNAGEPDVEILKNWAAEAEDAAMAVDGVTNSEGADVSYSTHKIALATSHGFRNSYQSSSFSVSASVVAGKGLEKESDYDYSVAHHREDLLAASHIGKVAGERSVRRLNPRKVPTCQVPIVFESRVARSILGSFAGAINGAAVAKGTTFLVDKMGEQIFSKGITVVDDPLLKRGLASEPFDGEGVCGQRREMIKEGVLTSWTLDIRSANKLGLVTTGHATRGTSSVPRPSRSNLYMQPGDVSFKDLISDIESGFFVTDTFGMGVNDVTGDYSQGAGGFWIEKGEICFPVSELTIAGNLLDMFKELTPADDLEFRAGTNCPSFRIEGMTVAGE